MLRVEIFAQGRVEQRKPLHAVLAAKLGKLFAFLLNLLFHSGLPYTIQNSNCWVKDPMLWVGFRRSVMLAYFEPSRKGIFDAGDNAVYATRILPRSSPESIVDLPTPTATAVGLMTLQLGPAQIFGIGGNVAVTEATNSGNAESRRGLHRGLQLPVVTASRESLRVGEDDKSGLRQAPFAAGPETV
jgi:hypothetical protein